MKTGKNFRIKVFGGIEVTPIRFTFRIKENHLHFFLRTDVLYLFLCGLHGIKMLVMRAVYQPNYELVSIVYAPDSMIGVLEG